jgi:hypothetical protein
VARGEDDGLPWPDVEKIAAWWHSNGRRFASDTRYFEGEPPSTAHCLDDLTSGFERQPTVAAVYLCLPTPGMSLFNTAASAGHQQHLLSLAGRVTR